MYYIIYYNIININTHLYIYYKYISFTIIIYSSMYQPTGPLWPLLIIQRWLTYLPLPCWTLWLQILWTESCFSVSPCNKEVAFFGRVCGWRFVFHLCHVILKWYSSYSSFHNGHEDCLMNPKQPSSLCTNKRSLPPSTSCFRDCV